MCWGEGHLLPPCLCSPHLLQPTPQSTRYMSPRRPLTTQGRDQTRVYTCPRPNRAGMTQQAKAQILPGPFHICVILTKSFYFSGYQFPQWQSGETVPTLGGWEESNT